MCLDRLGGKITDFRPVPGEKDCYYGWKVFILERGRLRSRFMETWVVRPYNEWMQSHQVGISTGHFSYHTGFHCYATRKAARHFGYHISVRKVKFRKVLALGEELLWPVAVAAEMMILKG